MNISYTVHFRGIHEKQQAALLKMLLCDIELYPQRMSMESATIEEVKIAHKPAKKTAIEQMKIEIKDMESAKGNFTGSITDVPRPTVKVPVKRTVKRKVKSHGKS